ncbi:MAG: Hsp20/alpha crystallin family protein [Alphaproteobacteria bacterium]
MVLRSLVTPARYGFTRFGDYPFTSVQRALQSTLDEALGGLTTEAAAMSVRLDVKEDEKAFHVTAELPGLSDKEVEVTFDDGLLTIRGEKKIERSEEKDTWHITERRHGSFARQITLPTNVDANAIDAKFEKGVLNVTLPKLAPEQTAAKKINIKNN